jgi:2,3-bisphosphoglycerate-independent phosphoglycerate mutase
MKTAIIIPDGCADWAIESLDGKTPMQAAKTPNLDALAEIGIVGRSNNVPEGISPGSDVATLGLLGYDPRKYYTGRAPLEAAAMGIDLASEDWAVRCNLVTVTSSPDGAYMQSFTAGHISSDEAAELIEALNSELQGVQFYPGVSYRNLAVVQGLTSAPLCHPPHDFTDKPIADALPKGEGSEFLLQLMNSSRKIFADHPVNQKRLAAGKLPATQIWLWGIGQKPQLPLFREMRFQSNLRGAMITAVDLLRGIAQLIGWDIINVPGITGYVDTDYAAKGHYAAEALKDHDVVCVHIEATDESGHEGDYVKKIKALEEIDAKVIPPIWKALKSYGDWRLFVSPDHPTPCALKTHTADYVPWLLVRSDDLQSLVKTYDEETARNSKHRFDNGWETIASWF